nr:Glycosyl transferase domain containing protein [Haemonchus contortus]CDJ97974.1 Glycosyl transferase domain containing protein [Haemonchus contortus]
MKHEVYFESDENQNIACSSWNRYQHGQKVAEDRPPDRTLYYSVLLRDANSLNLTFPTIPKETEVIVIVCTKPNDVNIRYAIRRTWANPLFSETVRNRSISVLFLVGTGYMSTTVRDEIRKYNDILQVDVPDSYNNLVYKIMAAFRFIAANYPHKYVLKIDSDVVILLDKIYSRLEYPEVKSIMCYVHYNALPSRDPGSKWYIPESLYPEKYLPDYCSGPTYLITPAALTAILEVVWKAKVFEVEDAFFTGVLAKLADVQIRKERGIWDRLKPSQPCVNGKGTVISYPVHNAGPKDLLESWKILRSMRWIVVLISNDITYRRKAKERTPNYTLYHDLLHRDIDFLNISSPTVHSESKVIVIVCSRPNDTDMRDAIRQTWANPHFSTAVHNKIASVVFVTGSGSASALINNEQQNYNDILHVDVPESYAALVYKIFAAYRWISATYPEKFVLKVDSDVVLLLDKVIPLLKQPHERYMLCHIHKKVQPIRDVDSLWYIPESSYFERYLPDYCNGPTYLISPAALAALIEVAWRHKVFEVEDAFFTGVLARSANVQLVKEPGFWNRLKSSQPCVNGEGTMISYPVHYAGPEELLELWKKQLIRCRYLIEQLIMPLIMDD